METNQTSQKQMEEKFSYKINLPEHEKVGEALDVYGLLQSAKESLDYELSSAVPSDAKLFLDRAISKMSNLMVDIAANHVIINAFDRMVREKRNAEEMRYCIQVLRNDVKKNAGIVADLVN